MEYIKCQICGKETEKYKWQYKKGERYVDRTKMKRFCSQECTYKDFATTRTTFLDRIEIKEKHFKSWLEKQDNNIEDMLKDLDRIKF